MKLPARFAFLKDWSGVLPAGALALLPFLLWHRQFAELFWFGDEWDSLDQIDRLGLWHWIWLVFAENFVPLFKLIWGCSVWLGGGGYFFMLLLLWLTHATNTVLLGRLLRRAGFGWFATLLTQAVFALTPINIETLGWSVVWSAALATTFLLLALDSLLPWLGQRPPERREIARLVVYSAGSAFCFSRGVLTGAVVALACLWPSSGEPFATTWRRRLGTATLGLLPALVAAGLIVLLASGNHQHLGSHVGSAVLYAVWYFCLNPLHRLLEIDSWGPRTTVLLGAAKLAVIIWGLRNSSGRVRLLLGLLLVFDLGNAALLGLGRYHTGLETVISSRYQYTALVATLPFFGLWLESLGRSWPARPRRYAAGVALLAIALLVVRRWPEEITAFAAERGTATRQLLLYETHPPAQGAVPGIPLMPTDRAKELIRRYDLH